MFSRSFHDLQDVSKVVTAGTEKAALFFSPLPRDETAVDSVYKVDRSRTDHTRSESVSVANDAVWG